MGILRLPDWDIEDVDYLLVGIHATSVPYRLAYFINKYLGLGLSRTEKDQDIRTKTYQTNYPVYNYYDTVNNTTIYLLPNKYMGITKALTSTYGLFNEYSDNTIKTVLLKEFKTVDYLIKIENNVDHYPIKKMIHNLSQIPQVISAYSLDHHKIKNHDYLIFE